MKKAKQKNLYEEKSDPMGGLDMQLEGDDEDIIELEDIIEMPDRPIDEEEDLDLDVEIFDVDEELESSPEEPVRKSGGRRVEEGAREAEDAELLESFAAEMGEDDMLFESAASVSEGEPSAVKGQPQVSDEDEEEPFPDDLAAKPDSADTQREKQAALRARAEAALKISEESRSEEVEAAIPSEAAVQPAAAAAASVEGASVSEIKAVAEDLVDRIESRLQEHIRVVVETTLPGLVRTILDEEITKLKKELE